MSVLVAALWAGLAGAGFAHASDPRVPDNRDLKLDPEDSVPPFYRTYARRARPAALRCGPRGRRDLPAHVPGAVHGAGDTRAAGRSAGRRRGACAGAAAGRVRGVPEAGTPGGAGAGRRHSCRRCAPGGRVYRRADRGLDAPSGDRPRALPRNGSPRSGRGVARRRIQLEPSGGPTRGRGVAAGLPHVPAGAGLYARTMYAVDSDYPGPVLLEILEPPLAGAVASGAFALVGERLTLRLTPPGVPRPELRRRRLGGRAGLRLLRRGRRGRQPLVRTGAAAGVGALRRGLPHRPLAARARP